MFGEQFHLQKPGFFSIGQSPSVLALFVVPGTKVPALAARYLLLHIA